MAFRWAFSSAPSPSGRKVKIKAEGGKRFPCYKANITKFRVAGNNV